LTAPSTTITVRTLDGLHLAGTLIAPEAASDVGVVLVHGAGVTREEGGFFTRLADGLAEIGVFSLRYDLRGHGESDGRQEEVTLSAYLNDVRVALAHVRQATAGASRISLLGTSFGGCLAAYYAAKQQHRPRERGHRGRWGPRELQ